MKRTNINYRLNHFAFSIQYEAETTIEIAAGMQGIYFAFTNIKFQFHEKTCDEWGGKALKKIRTFRRSFITVHIFRLKMAFRLKRKHESKSNCIVLFELFYVFLSFPPTFYIITENSRFQDEKSNWNRNIVDFVALHVMLTHVFFLIRYPFRF